MVMALNGVKISVPEPNIPNKDREVYVRRCETLKELKAKVHATETVSLERALCIQLAETHINVIVRLLTADINDRALLDSSEPAIWLIKDYLKKSK